MPSSRFPIIDMDSTSTPADTPLVAFKRGKDKFSYQSIQEKDPKGAGLDIYRAQEIDEVRQLIAEQAFVVLIGPAGCGKSHILKTIAKEHPDTLLFDEIVCLSVRHHDWYIDEAMKSFRRAIFSSSRELVLIDEVASDPTSVAIVHHATKKFKHILAAFGGPLPNETKINLINKAYPELNPVFVEMSLKPLTENQIQELVWHTYQRRYGQKAKCDWELNNVRIVISHLSQLSHSFPVDSSLIRGVGQYSNTFTCPHAIGHIHLRTEGTFHYNEGCCIALPDAIKNGHEQQYLF